MRPGVLAGIGGFGALFEVPKQFKEPVLVSGTDGVGTKLRLAFEWNRHDTVGIDLVAMSVNDILVQGAEPLFFLDYRLRQAVGGYGGVRGGRHRQGCELSGCALIGGETAEMPGMYPDGEYDLAGFAVGAVEKSAIIDGKSIKTGDVVLGLASSGAHSNGYSLVRKILERANARPDQDFHGQPLVDVVMAPTRIYVKQVLAALAKHGTAIKGLAHITGGGLLDNVPRILQPGLSAAAPRRLGNAQAVPVAAAAGRRGRHRNAPRLQLRHRHGAGGRRRPGRRHRRDPARAGRDRQPHRRDRRAAGRHGADFRGSSVTGR